ncbi:MAG: hypothetical protein Q4G33_08765 [bacterium]|nr:hypothetical protein [bacterium]
MKKIITLLLTAAIITSASTAFAGTIPRECTPLNADERAVQITENIISPYLDEASDGLGYALACGRANTAIRKAVIANETEGYSYTDLSPIAQNAIRTVCDMRLRPEAYKQAEDELRVLLADIIVDVQNGKDYMQAVKEAYIKIYRTVEPSFNYDEQFSLDTCYRHIPAVGSEKFTVAKRLLLEALQNSVGDNTAYSET